MFKFKNFSDYKTIPLKIEMEKLCKTVIGLLSKVLQIAFLVDWANMLSSAFEPIWNIQDSFLNLIAVSFFFSSDPELKTTKRIINQIKYKGWYKGFKRLLNILIKNFLKNIVCFILKT